MRTFRKALFASSHEVGDVFNCKISRGETAVVVVREAGPEMSCFPGGNGVREFTVEEVCAGPKTQTELLTLQAKYNLPKAIRNAREQMQEVLQCVLDGSPDYVITHACQAVVNKMNAVLNGLN